MKTVKKLGISGGMLSAAKDAEASLARREAEDLGNSLPEGHPLQEEVEKQKALVGDLSGLPPGHPLLRALQAAKERYDQQQAQRAEEQGKAAEVRKSQTGSKDEDRRKARAKEDEQTEQWMEASARVNTGLKNAIESIRVLYKVLADNEEILNIEPLSRAKVGRMRRLLYATERGLSDGRIVRARA
jgi:hypothetical protein